MRSPIEIRNDATACLRLAEQAKAPRQKSLFLMMAQAWTMLAQQAEGIGAPAEGADAGALAEPKPTRH
ncbi:MAG TPA: hypothetical protein VEK73_20180 [Xanthobacteraceae bacterium]|nr:hypothetical protein [Xanthobacteraceae bacterium]